jgi:hypothetical protein
MGGEGEGPSQWKPAGRGREGGREGGTEGRREGKGEGGLLI